MSQTAHVSSLPSSDGTKGRGLSSPWDQGESPEVLPGSLAPTQPPSNQGAHPLPDTHLAALQCQGPTLSPSPERRPCLTPPATPGRDSRAWSNARHGHGIGLTTGYLRSCGRALTPYVWQPASLRSLPGLLLCSVESHLHCLPLTPSVHTLVGLGSRGSFPSLSLCEWTLPAGEEIPSILGALQQQAVPWRGQAGAGR